MRPRHRALCAVRQPLGSPASPRVCRGAPLCSGLPYTSGPRRHSGWGLPSRGPLRPVTPVCLVLLVGGVGSVPTGRTAARAGRAATERPGPLVELLCAATLCRLARSGSFVLLKWTGSVLHRVPSGWTVVLTQSPTFVFTRAHSELGQRVSLQTPTHPVASCPGRWQFSTGAQGVGARV